MPYFCKFPTLVLDDRNGHVLHQIGVEFHQEFNEHGPRHVTRVFHVSDTCTFLTLVLDDRNGHVLHQNGVEFHQEFNGHGPDTRHVYFKCPTHCAIFLQSLTLVLDDRNLT